MKKIFIFWSTGLILWQRVSYRNRKIIQYIDLNQAEMAALQSYIVPCTLYVESPHFNSECRYFYWFILSSHSGRVFSIAHKLHGSHVWFQTDHVVWVHDWHTEMGGGGDSNKRHASYKILQEFEKQMESAQTNNSVNPHYMTTRDKPRATLVSCSAKAGSRK